MRPRWLAALLACLTSVELVAPVLSAVPDSPSNSTLAWIRFDEATQEYAGKKYLYLGDGDLRLTIDVRPQAGHAIELLWGAKSDMRDAVLSINGRAVAVNQGGYNGFNWKRIVVPEGVAGDRYELVLQAPPAGRPAFLAEVRLTSTAKADAPPDMKASAAKITAKLAPPSPPARAEAFPEMRKLWDRQPPPPAKPDPDPKREAMFQQAERNSRLAAEALYRCRRFVDGWLAQADPKTGLIPRNLRESRDFWNGRDSAADNYPYMVLTCALTDRALFDGRMLDMLRTETRLTSRIDRLPDDYSFSKQGWRREKIDLDAIIFDGAEYVKDGLIPLTEWLGQSPWSHRALGIIDDIWRNASIDTPFGKIPTLNAEVNGDLLQACSRLYWFTGDRKYLDWAIRLGDYFLLGDQHPTRNFDTLRLKDHGCEVVNGLAELYAAVSFAAPQKREAYRKPIHDLLDRILEVARNEDGMLYSSFNPKTGEHSKTITDTWGYDYDAFYTVYLIDKTDAYRTAVRHVLGNLKGKYVGAPWDDKSADGYADSIEGAINLYNREPVESAPDWIDSQIKMMWAIQKSDGTIEGWHGDGNGARTSIMYALWKTQGITIQPWRADVRVGGVRDGQTLYISLAADQPWSGKVIFDKPRHKLHMKLPLDYPRINQFPEWFTADADRQYTLIDTTSAQPTALTGKQLRDGITAELKPGIELRWHIVARATSP